MLTWNVGGLLSKLTDNDFVDYIKSFDVICLTETYVEYNLQIHVFADFNMYFSPAKKLSHHGRCSGGVIVLVRTSLSHHFEQLQHAEQTVVLKISKKLFNTDKYIIFVATYVPPYGSAYYNTADPSDGIDGIEQSLTGMWELFDDFYILLCGDLNARTANLNSCLSARDVQDNDADEVMYERSSDDETVNTFGRKLIEVCQMFQCSILNGCHFFNADRGHTYISQSGSSLVDYFCASNDICEQGIFSSLKVENRVESDHLPVTLTVHTTQTNKQIPRAQGHWEEKLCWDTSKGQLYLEALRSGEIQNRLVCAKAEIDTNVNSAVGLFVESLQSAAECMKKRVFVGGQKRKSQWFDQECAQAKREVKTYLRMYNSNKSQENRRHFVETRRQYRIGVETHPNYCLKYFFPWTGFLKYKKMGDPRCTLCAESKSEDISPVTIRIFKMNDTTYFCSRCRRERSRRRHAASPH